MARPDRLYVPLDASYYEDGAVAELSPMAELLFVRALCLAMRVSREGGVLTRRQLYNLAPTGADADALIDELTDGPAPLLAEEPGPSIASFHRYRVVSWDLWHADPEDQSRKGTKGNHVRWHVRRGKVDPSCRWCRSSQDDRPDSPAMSPGPSEDIPEESQRNRQAEQSRAEQSILGSDSPSAIASEVRKATGIVDAARLADPIPAAPPVRPRDEVFETLAGACGIDWQHGLTKSARGELNMGAAQLREVGATPVEIERRAFAYGRLFPGAALTPAALVKHWPKLSENTSGPSGPSAYVENGSNSPEIWEVGE